MSDGLATVVHLPPVRCILSRRNVIVAMTERSRSALYRGLSDLIEDEEAVGEMLSYFPARDADEPASKDFIDARLSQMDARLSAMETRLMAEIHAQSAAFNAQMRTMVQWTLAAMVGLIGLVVAMGFLQAP
jgi:hypothetical protein